MPARTLASPRQLRNAASRAVLTRSRPEGDAFDPETAEKLEEWVLSKGDSQPADELWLKFRERKPGVHALLKGRGLLAEAS